eukprot:GHVQ01043329.1.p1 GENE.GHVQ01043329.1~~GHVQ01043329.1.p1  ORF type:complete len:176 (+),score=21.30 GHVQ01043329.1:635-1162(+)
MPAVAFPLIEVKCRQLLVTCSVSLTQQRNSVKDLSMAVKKTRKRANPPPVKRRPKDPQFKVHKHVRDTTLRMLWDKNKTLLQNRAAIFINDFSHHLSERPYCPVNKRISERDFQIVTSLRDKHGDDVKAMTRDLHRNCYQWTETVCRKMLKKHEEAIARMNVEIKEKSQTEQDEI